MLAAAYSARNRKKMLAITQAVLVMAPAAPTMGRATKSWTRSRRPRRGMDTFFSPIHSQPATTPMRIRQPTDTHRAFTAPTIPVVLKKGEKQMDAATGATVLLIREHRPNTPPKMAPAMGPSRMAPRITGIWVVVALMVGS